MKKVTDLYTAEYESEFLAKKIDEYQLPNVTVDHIGIMPCSDPITSERRYLTFISVKGNGAACAKETQTKLIRLIELNGWHF